MPNPLRSRFPFFAAALLALLAGGCGRPAHEFRSSWPREADRPWPGPDYWSNPLEDWRVHGGRLECIVAGGDRNVFLLTREVSEQEGALTMSVRLGRLEADAGPLGPGFAGFRFGIRGHFRDYRDSAVRGAGLDAGLSADGRLFIGRLEANAPRVAPPFQNLELRLGAQPAGGAYRVALEAFDGSGKSLAQVSRSDVQSKWLAGGLALVCSSGEVGQTPAPGVGVVDPGWGGKTGTARGGTLRFWFRDWVVGGGRVTVHEDRAFGPILFAMHTLSRKVLKLTAQMAPVGNAPQEVTLQVQDAAPAAWRTAATAKIDPLARTATFRLPNWNDARDTPYRVAYRMPDGSGKMRDYYYAGTIRKDPAAKPQIVAAAFTGNNDLGFPHADVVRHVSFFKPDLLIYTGDNIYERVAEYGIQRSPVETATLDYLRKWFLFGWEYGELLKEIPAVCLPDDHDVYHGNLWGAGGRRAVGEGYEGQDQGGYTMPPEWVNMVQRTQSSHLPDPFDPAPVEQGITVYYTSLVYGGLSLAVIEDRKWKSAPREFLPKAKIVNGWPQNPGYNAARDGDAPGAQLLGRRQLDFLNTWAADWSGGAWIKAVASQTIFANVATLPKAERGDNITPKLRVMQPGEYPPDEAPVMDHDSNGWPQTERNLALRAMRRGLAYHIAGDQHLGSTIQYGIDDFNDAGWAISVPAVANVWPRRWYPSEPGRNRKPDAPRYTGEFRDGFGNRMTVHAVSNPTVAGVEPAALYNRAPGYGIVTFDRRTRNVTMANWPRWVDPSQPGAKPYPGWPITIHQFDNGLSAARWTLEPVEAPGQTDPIVQVIDQATGEVVYTLRIQGSRFIPKVFKQGLYTVNVTAPERGYQQQYKDRKARPAS